MAVKRLNNDERDGICAKFLEPARKEVRELSETVREKISAFVMSKAPREVVEMGLKQFK